MFLSIGFDLTYITDAYALLRACLGMKKWINSNYHYMVPEFDGVLKPDFTEYLGDVKRGMQRLGASAATPVVVGPVTLVYLTKYASFAKGYGTQQRQALLEKLIPFYKTLLADVAALGVSEIQIHEAALVMEDTDLLSLFQVAYPAILPKGGPVINMVSFMEDVGKVHYNWLISVPEISVISLDFTRGDNLSLVETFGFPTDKVLGAGIVDARSVWRVNPDTIVPILQRLDKHVGSIRIQPSASLQYVPWDLTCENDLLAQPAGPVLAFATQKLQEVITVANGCQDHSHFEANKRAWTTYYASLEKHQSIRTKVNDLTANDFARSEPFEVRRPKQLQGLPLLPTTTIGSFPQTKAIRLLRSKFNKGQLTKAEYERAIDQQIALAIGIQEGLGLDILVHGEAERTDMVEFFAQNLQGMLLTTNGWVQSFGSRCVRPPIIWADIHRPQPMTVREFVVAQALTDKPVKGMLTGPVTILNWSFPRADLSRREQAMQIGLCIRDEIADLEDAGCRVIQVDEPALREAMPLRKAQKDEYLTWAVDSFRLATAKARSETQIHTHMCYCEFDDCMEAIDRMDTDVNSIENARSDNATLLAFQRIGYTKDLGPGTYDIHSPVVPTVDFIVDKLGSFLQCMDATKLVVNPDCGLKTRTWPEVVASLKNMVEATKEMRGKL